MELTSAFLIKRRSALLRYRTTPLFTAQVMLEFVLNFSVKILPKYIHCPTQDVRFFNFITI
jgi:hypothetical protein